MQESRDLTLGHMHQQPWAQLVAKFNRAQTGNAIWVVIIKKTNILLCIALISAVFIILGIVELRERVNDTVNPNDCHVSCPWMYICHT